MGSRIRASSRDGVRFDIFDSSVKYLMRTLRWCPESVVRELDNSAMLTPSLSIRGTLRH
jgi:hypothetical protein